MACKFQYDTTIETGGLELDVRLNCEFTPGYKPPYDPRGTEPPEDGIVTVSGLEVSDGAGRWLTLEQLIAEIRNAAEEFFDKRRDSIVEYGEEYHAGWVDDAKEQQMKLRRDA